MYSNILWSGYSNIVLNNWGLGTIHTQTYLWSGFDYGDRGGKGDLGLGLGDGGQSIERVDKPKLEANINMHTARSRG